MPTDQERLVVLLEARIRDFEKNMQRAEQRGTRSYSRLRRDSRSATQAMEQDMVRGTSRINQALASTSTRIGTFSRAFLGGLAGGMITAAFAGISTSVTDTVRSVAQLGDEAKRAGLSAKAFQEWKFVAEQNRIGVDSLVDGFKELNLRADEFIVTGAGPAAEAFQRLGYTAAALREGLKDPSELMLDIIGRMQDLDRAAQIRVADEIFGGTGGERFVELLSQGEAGLRKTISRAHEAGAVLDAEMIQKAAELDRKFQELTTSAGNFFKAVVVGAADVAAEAADLRSRLDNLFPDRAQADALLGAGVADALEEDRDALDAHAEQVARIRQAYEQLGDRAVALVPELRQMAATLAAWGYSEASAELAAAADETARLVEGMRQGTISAQDFEAGLSGVTRRADAAVSSLDEIDRAHFSGVIAGIAGLAGALARAIELARTLRSELPGGSPSTSDDERGGNTGNARDAWTGTRNAPRTSPRPQRPGVDSYGDFLDSGASAGGGGGSAPKSKYASEVISIREATAALEAEAAALNAAQVAMRGYADVADYAAKRAELLVAAQKDGKEITPQLAAEIDRLAQEYVKAANGADLARERHQAFEDALEQTRSSMEGAFTGLVTGAHSFRDALGMVISRLAEMAASRAFDSLWSGGLGGIMAKGLGFLGFEAGGYTGDGPAQRVAGVVHGGEYVFSKRATSRIGVANLEALHRSAKGYASGGHVAPARAPAASFGVGPAQGAQTIESKVDVRCYVDRDGAWQAAVEKISSRVAGKTVSEGLRTYNDKVLPQRISETNRDPRRR
uniref:Uncharacterized protein n=1 Tax=Cereibacter sphaeroides (strain ATCC 17025 / ATH 2.4.3) TaxID=349102 RepID=A4WSA4_CERS5